MLKRFFILSFVLSWLLTVTIALQVHGIIPITILPYGVSWLAGLIPGIVAVSLIRNKREFLIDYLKRGLTIKPLIIVLVLTFGFLALIYFTHQAIGSPIKLQSFNLFTVVQGTIWFVLAAGEELGWRGFALPVLMKKHTLFKSAAVLGIIWCVWHYPKIIGSPFLKDWQMAVTALVTFSIQILAGNFIICWLYARFNKSVWLTTLYHTFWNIASTLYLFMAMDNLATILLVCVSLVIVFLERNLFFGKSSMDQ